MTTSLGGRRRGGARGQTRRGITYRAAAVLALPVVGAACQRTDVPATGPEGTSTAPVTVELASWSTAEIEQALADEFAKTAPRITVKPLTSASAAEHHEKMTTLLVSGSVPDLLYLNPQNAAGWMTPKRLRVLDQWVQRDKIDLASYPAGNVALATANKQLYTLPTGGGSRSRASP